MKRLIRLFFVLIFFAACESVPDGVLRKSDMISLLTDMHLVDGYTGVLRQDTAKKIAANLYQSVFNKYHIDSVQFRKSIQYYSRNPEEFSEMYDKVKENLDSLSSEQTRRFEEKARAR